MVSREGKKSNGGGGGGKRVVSWKGGKGGMIVRQQG